MTKVEALAIEVLGDRGRQRVETWEHTHGAHTSLTVDELDSGTRCVTQTAFCREEFDAEGHRYIVTIHNFNGEHKWSDIDIWDCRTQDFVFTGELHTLVEKLRS